MNYHLATMSAIDFPAWLQKQIDKKGWKPTELAKLSGVSDAAISRFLLGKRKPDPDSLNAIASALKIKPEIVFREAGLLPPEPASDEWVENTNYKIKLIPPRLREIFDGFVDKMIEGEENNNQSKPKPAKRGVK